MNYTMIIDSIATVGSTAYVVVAVFILIVYVWYVEVSC